MYTDTNERWRTCKQHKSKARQGIVNLNGLYRTSMWCRGRDSNPHRNSHYHLKIACLPIPPPRREKRYMQNRGGWQAFFCDSVKFFRLSAWGPGLFPCAGVTDGSSGEDPHSLLWKGRRNLFVSAAEGSFLGAAESSAWGSRFDPHVRGGWAAAERRAFPSIYRKGLPCRAVACQCRGNRLNKDGGHERLV